jgi:hypothetical protein
MARSWLVVLARSAAAPQHVPLAVPTTTTMSVHDFLAQAAAGGSAWNLRHVRVHGVLEAVERDGSGCITAVTLRDGTDSVRCVLVDPEPIPLHAAATVDGQVSLEGTPPSLIHSRVMAPPGDPGDHVPACADPTEKPAGSAAP